MFCPLAHGQLPLQIVFHIILLFIYRLEKPQMSLVVWKPRENILSKLKEVNEDEEKKPEPQEEEVKRRNGVLVAEPSGMDIEM